VHAIAQTDPSLSDGHTSTAVVACVIYMSSLDD